MLRIARSLVVSGVVVGATMFAAPVAAQQQGGADLSAPRATPAPAPTAPSAADTTTPTLLGPSMSAATAGFRPDAAAATTASDQGPQLPENGNQRKGAIFMIVGGAAMLGGAIVGEEAGAVIMIGGVLMTLYGLYTYLN